MTWNSYEELVKNIYEQLGKDINIKIEGYGNNCKVKGKSGVMHQIDVLTSHSSGLHTFRTAIECKYWKYKVQKDSVTKLAEIIEDAQIEKGVIVSKTGFTDDAISFAKYKNISLVELREPTDRDWEGRIKDFFIDFHIMTPLVYAYKFIQDQDATLKPAQSIAKPTEVFFHEPNKARISLMDIINKKINEAQDGINPCRVIFPDDTYMFIERDNSKSPIRGVDFIVEIKTEIRNLEIKSEEYVSMIMLSLFENKRFVISHDGSMRKSEND